MAESPHPGATAVITHRVRDARHEDYERWLTQILPTVTASPGFLDVQLIRPVRGLTDGYTIVLRFTCEDDLRRWMTSPERQKLIDTVRPILAHGDAYTIHSGVDFLFAPQGGAQKVPVRWKQFLVTWSAIFPLTLALPLLLAPALRAVGLYNRFVITLLASGLAVLLMVYLIMPRYTQLVRRWLFR